MEPAMNFIFIMFMYAFQIYLFPPTEFYMCFIIDFRGCYDLKLCAYQISNNFQQSIWNDI